MKISKYTRGPAKNLASSLYNLGYRQAISDAAKVVEKYADGAWVGNPAKNALLEIRALLEGK